MAEWTEIQQPTPDAFLDHWKMYFDGSLKLGEAGMGVLFISPEGKQLKYVLQILWQATNDEAEYEALIHGLRITTSLGIKWLLVYGNLAVVINQVNKDWDCTKDNMDAYCAEVQKLEKNFQGLEILHVLRFKHSDRCSRQTRIGQSEGPARCVCRVVAVSLHKIT
jgi:ribonuclease HI